MDKNTILLIGALFASPFIGDFVKGFFNKRKNGAEIQNLNISGEISIGDAWKDYAKNQEQINKSLIEEIKDLRANIFSLNKEFIVMNQQKDAEIVIKDKKIQDLENRIDTLEKEVEIHKNK